MLDTVILFVCLPQSDLKRLSQLSDLGKGEEAELRGVYSTVVPTDG